MTVPAGITTLVDGNAFDDDAHDEIRVLTDWTRRPPAASYYMTAQDFSGINGWPSFQKITSSSIAYRFRTTSTDIASNGDMSFDLAPGIYRISGTVSVNSAGFSGPIAVALLTGILAGPAVTEIGSTTRAVQSVSLNTSVAGSWLHDTGASTDRIALGVSLGIGASMVSIVRFDINWVSAR
jgi:hypothetical protein